MKSLLAALLTITLSLLLPAAEPPTERFEDLRARARTMSETEPGKTYEGLCAAKFTKPLGDALGECTKDTKPPYTVALVFVIGADGATQRIVPAPDQPVAACVAKKLGGLKFSKPPKGDWLVSVSITIKE